MIVCVEWTGDTFLMNLEPTIFQKCQRSTAIFPFNDVNEYVSGGRLSLMAHPNATSVRAKRCKFKPFRPTEYDVEWLYRFYYAPRGYVNHTAAGGSSVLQLHASWQLLVVLERVPPWYIPEGVKRDNLTTAGQTCEQMYDKQGKKRTKSFDTTREKKYGGEGKKLAGMLSNLSQSLKMIRVKYGREGKKNPSLRRNVTQSLEIRRTGPKTKPECVSKLNGNRSSTPGGKKVVVGKVEKKTERALEL
eukprot:GEMP01037548.1.p1 GENE.GEMP01037548.1~~GEMP01037548.1.p1  ORF type:complete len:246 (+),score=41.40 GEMP01037548.1:508-1245(+)